MASVDDIWLVDFGVPYPGEPARYRPAMVLGPPEAFGPDFPFVIVTPLTTTPRGLSLHVEVDPSATSGLSETSYIQCELIRSVTGNRLINRLGAVGPDVSHQVTSVVKSLLNY